MSKNKKNIKNFQLKNVIFTASKITAYCIGMFALRKMDLFVIFLATPYARSLLLSVAAGSVWLYRHVVHLHNPVEENLRQFIRLKHFSNFGKNLET